jgi:DNA-binding NarL/FixJ family response regulator
MGLARRLRPSVILAGLSVCAGRDVGALKSLKAQWPKASLLVVADSMSAADIRRALAAGCAGHLPKGADRQRLLSAVRAVSRGECIVEPRLLREALRAAPRRGVEAPDGLTSITAPEREVLRLVAEGLTNRRIARQLRYSVGTVKDYVQRIIDKLEVSDRTQAAVKAVRLGFLD